MREGSRARRRLVTGVRSGWGHVSRSLRTKYHICQQFVVEFGRVSVNTDALLMGEESGDVCLFAGSKTIDTRMLEQLWSIQIVIKCVHVPCIYDRLILMG